MNVINSNSRHSWRCRAWTTTAIVVVAALAAGCAESSRPEATGKGKVRGINAVVTTPELIFVIEERPLGNVNYRQVAGFNEWDDLAYNFSFDVIRPNATEADRLATQFIDVAADFEYSVMLTGTIANPTILSWEAEEREWDGTETVFEVDFVNASPLLGEVDVYYDVTGTAPVLGNEVGTVNFGDRLPYIEREQGEYELIITTPDDPSTILYQSPGFERLPAERITIALFDPDPSIVAAVGVNIIFDGGAVQRMADVNSLPQLRLTHAAFGTGNVDGFFNDDFGTAVFSNVAFDQSSPYVEFSETVLPVDITLTGDTGTVLAEADIQRLNNSRRSMILWGSPGTNFLRVLLHDARPIEIFPVVRMTHLAANVGEVDIYIVEPGTVIDDTVPPSFGGALPGVSTEFFPLDEGMHEFVITAAGEKTPVSTPVTFDLPSGAVMDLITVDAADPAAVDLRVFDSIP